MSEELNVQQTEPQAHIEPQEPQEPLASDPYETEAREQGWKPQDACQRAKRATQDKPYFERGNRRH